MQVVDLIVKADHCLTMSEDLGVIQQAAIAIVDGSIRAIGPESEISKNYDAPDVIDGRNRVLLPGLINGHTHSAMSLLRGYADDLELMEWLQDHINPIEARMLSPEFVRIGAQLACWEMLRGGVTSFVDMYFYHEEVAQVVNDAGMRGFITATVIDQPRPDSTGVAASIEQARDFITKWRGSALIHPILAGHAIYTLQPSHLKTLRRVALEFDVPVHIHISETQQEVAFSQSQYGKTPIAYFEDIGFLEGETIAAHVVWPAPDEFAIMQNHRFGVIHNPTSNNKLASGIAPVAKMVEHNIPVGIGTDGAASNNDLDVWEELRLASLMSKVSSMDATSLNARQTLAMGTSTCARAIGMEDEIGKLEVGMKADIVQLSLDDVHHLPVYDVESHLVYTVHKDDVVNVIVDGEVVVRDREVTTLDLPAIREAALAMGQRIAATRDELRARTD